MRDIIKSTLSEQIYSILREDIINQTIACGEKLNLKQLQERFDTSTTPIRDALNRLSQEGLINYISNIGVSVIDLNEKDINDIYDFCAILDTAALRMAFENNPDEFIRKLKDNIKSQEASLDTGNTKDFNLYSDNFHDLFYQFANNSRLYSAAITIRSQFSILTTKYQNFVVVKSIVVKEHESIAKAIESRDCEKAVTLLNNHFGHAKDYLLGQINNKSV